MIQPLQLRIHGDFLTIRDHKDSRVPLGEGIPVEVLTLDSGPFTDFTVAYIRYDSNLGAYPWQVLGVTPSTEQITHKAYCQDLNVAFHHAMAEAYDHVAFRITAGGLDDPQ